MIQHGGLVYYGGFIGAALAAVIYLLWKKMPVWKTADVLAPSIALGSVFGRVGCLLNGCCYGRPTDVPWAITFTNPLAHELSGTPLNVPLHPTEIYDALLNLLFISSSPGCSGAKNSTARCLRLICFATPSRAPSSNTSAAIIPISITTSASRRRNGSACRFSSPAWRWRRCSRAAMHSQNETDF